MVVIKDGDAFGAVVVDAGDRGMLGSDGAHGNLPVGLGGAGLKDQGFVVVGLVVVHEVR